MQTNEQIIIGKAPDYAIRSTAMEYYHHISVALTKGDVVIQSRSVSNKSLAQLVNVIKRMIAPWGWRRTDLLTWVYFPEMAGNLETEQGMILVHYHFLDMLTPDQKKRLALYITRNFAPILKF